MTKQKYGRFCPMCGIDLGENPTFQQVVAHDCPRKIVPFRPLPPNYCVKCGGRWAAAPRCCNKARSAA